MEAPKESIPMIILREEGRCMEAPKDSLSMLMVSVHTTCCVWRCAQKCACTTDARTRTHSNKAKAHVCVCAMVHVLCTRTPAAACFTQRHAQRPKCARCGPPPRAGAIEQGEEQAAHAIPVPACAHQQPHGAPGWRGRAGRRWRWRAPHRWAARQHAG